MGLQEDLDVILKQEKALQFESFGADTAWEVGCSLREQAMRRAAAMTFEIQLAGRVLFHAVTHHPPAGQADWIPPEAEYGDAVWTRVVCDGAATGTGEEDDGGAAWTHAG